jgi:hypothetical protein
MAVFLKRVKYREVFEDRLQRSVDKMVHSIWISSSRWLKGHMEEDSWRAGFPNTSSRG